MVPYAVERKAGNRTAFSRLAERYKRFVAIGNENTVYYSYAHRKHLFDFEQKFLIS